MSLIEAQVQFAAEFVTLVIIASALALLLLRPRRFDPPSSADHPARRYGQAAVSGLALIALGTAGFVHGSVLVSGHGVVWIGLCRVAASAVLVVAFPYPAGLRTVGATALRVGFLLWLAAGVVELLSGSVYTIDGLLVAGSLLAAAALLMVARRSIAVRVAASAALSLLLVVVVVALSLSTVISSSVQNQALARLSARSAIEKTTLTDSQAVSTDAQFVEANLAGFFDQSVDNPLTAFATGTPAQATAAGQQILAQLNRGPSVGGDAIVAYSNPLGTSLLVAGTQRAIPSPAFATRTTLNPPSCAAGRQGLFEIENTLWLGASSPECTTTGERLGVAVVAVPINTSYLADRFKIDPTVSLALLSGSTVFATAGTTSHSAQQLAHELAVPNGQSLAQAEGDQFVGSATVSASAPRGNVPIHLILATRATTVLSTRNQLFRTLFLLSFGGTVLALGLAIFTGDRITAGLRRLTRAATGIQGGDTKVRAGVAGDDEVAALGSAFDSMLDSVDAQSAALQAAADDEARLRNRLQAVVAGMTDALIAVDPFGVITDFNQAAVHLTGVEAAEALGTRADKVVRVKGEDGGPLSRQLFGRGAPPVSMAARIANGNADVPVALSRGSLRGPAGEEVGSVIVFRDLRREQEVEQMKTEFLSRVGHELRTPLTGILGYADILLRRTVPEERARAWHEDILLSARRLLRIVEMLEFFASEGAGRTVLSPEPVDVRALVNGIASSWAERLPANITMGRRLTKGATLVSADQRFLTLVIDELIDNAVKFSPEGGRIVLRVSSEDDVVTIAVSDQGMGMTAQQYAVVFGDFVQGDNSDTRRFGGLGLGLAVVRRVVEGHGGRISCRSAPGRGTTFLIEMPAWRETVPPTDPAATQPSRPPAGPEAARRPIKASRPARRSPTSPGSGS